MTWQRQNCSFANLQVRKSTESNRGRNTRHTQRRKRGGGRRGCHPTPAVHAARKAIRQADRMPHLILSSQYVRGIARPVSCRALVIEVFSVTECLQPAVLPAFVRKIADRDDLHLPPALRALNTIRFMSTHALPSAAAPVPCHLFHEARQHAIPGTARGAGTESFHQLQRHDQEGFINRNANH